jgi:hypothetical protein
MQISSSKRRCASGDCQNAAIHNIFEILNSRRLEKIMNWYMKVLKKYAVFNGRACRKEYWMFVLFNMIIIFVLAFIEGLIGGATKYRPERAD